MSVSTAWGQTQRDGAISEYFVAIPSYSAPGRGVCPQSLCPQSLIIPNATLYHFGVLTSSVHMAWMRVVAGRLKSDYRYSAAIVYNNFPWPGGGLIETALPSPDGAADLSTSTPLHGSTPSPNPCNPCNPWFDEISKTAQSILDARALYPDSSLADLYDPLTIPPELRKAHAANDAAVMKSLPKVFCPQSLLSALRENYTRLIADCAEMRQAVLKEAFEGRL